MKVMIDTNILISGFVLQKPGFVTNVLKILTEKRHEIYIDDYCLQEFGNVLGSKFMRNKKFVYEWKNIYDKLFFYEFKPIFSNGIELKYKTRDINDDRILNSAIVNKMDILLTGDSDYYGYRGSKTKVMNPRELVDLISRN